MQAVLLDIKAVCKITGLTRSRIYELMAVTEGPFPKPTKVGRSTRWYYDDVVAWTQRLRTPPTPKSAGAKGSQPRTPNTYARVQHYDWILNTVTGEFDRVLRSDRLIRAKPKPLPFRPVQSYTVHTAREDTGKEQTSTAKTALSRTNPGSRAVSAVSDVNGHTLRQQYEAGATVNDLVAYHRIGKARVLRILKNLGTALRKPGPRRKKVHAWPQLDR